MARHVQRSRDQLLKSLVLLAIGLLLLLAVGAALGSVGTVELSIVLGLGVVGTGWLCHRHVTQGRA